MGLEKIHSPGLIYAYFLLPFAAMLLCLAVATGLLWLAAVSPNLQVLISVGIALACAFLGIWLLRSGRR